MGKSINLNITASIVLYNNDIEELEIVIQCLLSTPIKAIYLIDNYSTNHLMFLKDLSNRIEYNHQPTNPGFGAGHNIAIKTAIKSMADYHFIVNPDISFKDDVVTAMIDYMAEDKEIGMMMPQILNTDNTVQNLPKLLPSPFSILFRKIKKPKKAYRNFINTYELRTVDANKIYNAPILSGCFTALNLNAIKEVGMYDDNYFMYFEDWDLSRRMHEFYKTIYFPIVSVCHGYESGANKSKRLFKIYINSAITYFNKWGWLFDSERKTINKKALLQFKS